MREHEELYAQRTRHPIDGKFAEGPLEGGEELVGFALDPRIICAPSVQTSVARLPKMILMHPWKI
jgi:hypothetical protein